MISQNMHLLNTHIRYLRKSVYTFFSQIKFANDTNSIKKNVFRLGRAHKMIGKLSIF